MHVITKVLILVAILASGIYFFRYLKKGKEAILREYNGRYITTNGLELWTETHKNQQSY